MVRGRDEGDAGIGSHGMPAAVEAVFIHGDGHGAAAGAEQQGADEGIAGVFEPGGISGVEENAGGDVKCLLGAGDDHDLGGIATDGAGGAQVGADRLRERAGGRADGGCWRSRCAGGRRRERTFDQRSKGKWSSAGRRRRAPQPWPAVHWDRRRGDCDGGRAGRRDPETLRQGGGRGCHDGDEAARIRLRRGFRNRPRRGAAP